MYVYKCEAESFFNAYIKIKFYVPTYTHTLTHIEREYIRVVLYATFLVNYAGKLAVRCHARSCTIVFFTYMKNYSLKLKLFSIHGDICVGVCAGQRIGDWEVGKNPAHAIETIVKYSRLCARKNLHIAQGIFLCTIVSYAVWSF